MIAPVVKENKFEVAFKKLITENRSLIRQMYILLMLLSYQLDF